MLTIHSESLLVSDSLSSLSSRAIVMLCNIEESGKRKCEPYWPVVIGTPVRLERSEGSVVSVVSPLRSRMAMTSL